MSLILSGTDGVSDVDGSAAAPAIRGADTNTGIFFPAADTIAFSEGGAEVARITNTAAWSFGASGTATGTSGQVLTSAGSAAAPTWTTPSAGAMILISTLTASGASEVSWTGLATYDTYLLLCKNVTMSNSYVTYQVGTGSGPTYITTALYRGARGNIDAASGVSSAAVTTTKPELHFPNASGPWNGSAYFFSMTGSKQMMVTSQFMRVGNGIASSITGSSVETTGPFTAIRIQPETSTFSGTFSLYGISQ